MNPEVQKRVLALLELHEGRSPYMYPDSKGNSTVGVGHLLPNVQSALLLPFRLAGAPSTRASLAQVSAGWASVRSFRKPYHALELDEPSIDDLVISDLKQFEPVMATFPQELPEAVETALWDMVFNLGSFHKFPLLVEAVHAGDWGRAAEECTRKDVGTERNADTRALFLAASVHTEANV
jgi:GH24 family phage-related lysozyme (muramidase)